MSKSRLRFVSLSLAVPLLLASGCKKPTPVPTEDSASATRDLDPDARLNITSIDPSVVPAGAPFHAMIYGSGFDERAQVTVNYQGATSVRVQSARSLDFQGPSLQPGRYDVQVTQGDESSTLYQALTVQDRNAAACEYFTVYFDLGDASLRADSLDALGTQLACLNQTTAPITIEGHCDERGTTEYNLALGYRRSNEVGDWLRSHGVSPDRIQTLSYGEERPVDRGHTEAAWAKNRRAEVRLGR